MDRKRTCIGCGEKGDKSSMFRIVKAKDGRIAYDPTGRAAGRGAYVCGLACLEKAKGTKRLAASLKCAVPNDLSEDIARQIMADGSFEIAIEE